MQFKTFFSALVLAAPALAETVRPNVYFNNDQRQLSAGGCSNLESRYATLGDVPSWPNVAGAYFISADNQTLCGTCWQVTAAGAAGGRTVFVAAVAGAVDGVELGDEPYKALTNHTAAEMSFVAAA